MTIKQQTPEELGSMIRADEALIAHVLERGTSAKCDQTKFNFLSNRLPHIKAKLAAMDKLAEDELNSWTAFAKSVYVVLGDQSFTFMSIAGNKKGEKKSFSSKGDMDREILKLIDYKEHDRNRNHGSMDFDEERSARIKSYFSKNTKITEQDVLNFIETEKEIYA